MCSSDLKLRRLRVHGDIGQYEHLDLGMNSRLDSLQAAVLRVKLKQLDNWSAARQANADRYASQFQQAGILDAITLPKIAHERRHVFNQYCIRVENGRRDHVMQQLKAAPGLLAPPQAPFLSGGKQWLAALSGSGAFVGIPSNPAKPGDTIVTFGVGFGATNPAVAAGQKTSAATRVSAPLVITVGGVQLTDAQIQYAGLVPPYVGLYQFNLVVPNVPDGDQPMTVQLGGVALPQTLLLSVKK